MTDIFKGVAAPDVNTTTTKETVAPDYYKNYLSGIASTGENLMPQSGVSGYSGLVAGLQAGQLAGLSGISGAATAYQSGLSGALSAAGDVAGGLTPAQIQNFMNPFQANVTNEMARLSQQNLQRNLMPALKGAFTSTGGMGSQRMMGALGQMGADVQSALTGAQSKELSTGYTNAVAQALKNLEMRNIGAKTEADLAAKSQELGLTGQEAMIKAGALEQAQKQAEIDAPMKRAKEVADLMRGYNVPVKTTETYKGPMAGVYGTSPLSQMVGLGTMIGALNTGASGRTPLQNFFDLFKPAGTSGVVDLGGGLKIKYDASGNPTFEGTSSDGTSQTNDEILESMGYTKNADGSWTLANDANNDANYQNPTGNSSTGYDQNGNMIDADGNIIG